ncbi:hypothetical protein GCM10009661_53510 [Catellatospora chokoriensis]|uniref:Aminoglycoside phosphotransferase domain-containing protein n=2 Tax=Catellatospora chokoriensis TaxID=310353 RepID=A0A8J3NUU2_9ACTN|nr:hypothetical protein Cch02nite_50090 [Catellatospora chokoriensis]
MATMRWLSDPSSAALRDALRAAAPDLAGLPLSMRDVAGRDEPLWQASSALLDDAYVVKFAWSEPAARRVGYEMEILAALTGEVPCIPQVVVASVDPVLLVTRKEGGDSLFAVADTMDVDRTGAQLAAFLAALHHVRVPGLLDAYDGPQHPAPTAVLRERLGHWMPVDTRWYGWIDATLASPRPPVPCHSDLHGDNQVWAGGDLRLVVDFETAGWAEPEYDLRLLPGLGPGVELLRATAAHYERESGRLLDLERVMAWHVRSVLGDALWRCAAGVALPDGRTPARWVDDLTARLGELGVGPR